MFQIPKVQTLEDENKQKKMEELLNTQGCTNMAGTALKESELPSARGNQAERVDKALGKLQRAGRHWKGRRGELPPASRTNIL